MTITLKLSEFEELWLHNQIPLSEETDGIETLFNTPQALGAGYHRELEIDSEFSIAIWEIQGWDDVRVKMPSEEHPIEFGVLLSGCISSDVNGSWDHNHTLISGGGIQRKMMIEYHQDRPIIGINIQLSPSRFAMLFPGEDGQIEPELAFLAKGNDWQSIFYPPNTAEIARMVQQIRDCPYRGTIKRMYLQAKALEIMSLQLAPLLVGGAAQTESPAISPQLKAQTIAKLHHAQEMIRSNLDNPPTSTELSQQLDLSDRTLRRGFRSLFGMTMVGYLTEQRLQQAELLLRNTDRTVADIANYVGYAHLGYFAQAFRRKYGVKPSDCRSRSVAHGESGEKSV